jgi:hypothetical protein
MTNQSQDLAAAHHPDVALAMLAAFVQSAYEAAGECETQLAGQASGQAVDCPRARDRTRYRACTEAHVTPFVCLNPTQLRSIQNV